MHLQQILKLPSTKTSVKLSICALLVVFADFLFYGHYKGWSIGLFDLTLLVSVLACNRHIEKYRHFWTASLAAFGLILALIISPEDLTIFMFAITIITLALLPQFSKLESVKTLFKNVIYYAITGWYRFYCDNVVILHIRKRSQKFRGKGVFILSWFLPISLSAVFIMLFASANPIITAWFRDVNLLMIFYYFPMKRIVFWVVTAAICWSLIRPKFMQRKKREIIRHGKTDLSFMALLFNERSILISLILFNALFFIQNLLDITFLWSGAQLPNGMTHAQYAHQGAYPLIVTALLAALFVLIAFKPGSQSEKMPSICALVYAWIGQNVFLVISSITRTLGYIEEYSLTYLRVNALIWMGLVALGLLLIIARIHLKRSNTWLVNCNGFALYATLYICCFINFGEIIANYNVHHSREVTSKGANLDIYYLQSEIGTSAIPALIWFEKNSTDWSKDTFIKSVHHNLEADLNRSINDWRGWTLRDYRLWLTLPVAQDN